MGSVAGQNGAAPTPQPPPRWYSQANAVCHFTNVTEIGILKVFIDFKVFDTIPDEGSISIPDLCEKINAQQSIVERFANMMVLKDILAEPEPGYLAHTIVSRGYKTGGIPAGLITYIFDFYLFPIAYWPEYFEKHGLREPEASVTPLGLAMGYPDRDFYGVLKTNPKKEAIFNGFMNRISGLVSLKGLYDFDWVKEAIEKGDKERTLVVDIGGGKGQGLKSIFGDYPYIPQERCVLMDRPMVIEENRQDVDDEVLKTVKMVEGDMFKEVPVKNALIYHISRVLNDWPDSNVLQVLKHVRASCAPDSRLLIVEEPLLPKPTGLNLAQDIFLLNSGGKRRNEKMFQELGAQSGWKVKDTYMSEKCGVVELVPVCWCLGGR